MYRIDYEKIRHNISLLKNNDYIVLKSNAYGFGFKEVLEIAIDEGMYKFAVIDLDEAIYIKNIFSNARVLFLGPFDKNSLETYEKYKIELSVTNLNDIDVLKNYNIDVQIEIDSGMNRFGIRAEDIFRTLNLIDKNNLKLVGLYSHNSTTNPTFISNQIESFYYAVKEIDGLDIHFSASSLINKIIRRQTCRRIGEFIYDGSLTISAKVISIKEVFKGEGVGYDFAFKMKDDGFIGVIDIGYADGLERECDGFLVWINNAYYPLVGKACMNYAFVLLDGKEYLGSEVIIIGKYNVMKNYEIKFNKIPHQIYVSFLKSFPNLT